jgi:16S rRNA (guanine966-N2)-methyltransferase
MPRIVAGAARGRRLKAPDGTTTRPTSDRTREALFSALESMLGSWNGRSFLDLYAGSGAVGLEAASRGASSVVLVESDQKAVRVLRANVEHLGLPGTSVVGGPVEKYAQGRPPAVDVVFADPPYSMATSEVHTVLLDLLATGTIGQDTVVVVERATRRSDWSWPAGLVGLREKAYGEGTLWYGRAAGSTPDEVPGGRP